MILHTLHEQAHQNHRMHTFFQAVSTWENFKIEQKQPCKIVVIFYDFEDGLSSSRCKSLIYWNRWSTKLKLKILCLAFLTIGTILTLWHAQYLLCWIFKEETTKGSQIWGNNIMEGGVYQECVHLASFAHEGHAKTL